MECVESYENKKDIQLKVWSSVSKLGHFSFQLTVKCCSHRGYNRAPWHSVFTFTPHPKYQALENSHCSLGPYWHHMHSNISNIHSYGFPWLHPGGCLMVSLVIHLLQEHLESRWNVASVSNTCWTMSPRSILEFILKTLTLPCLT